MNSQFKLSVIILNYNVKHFLELCLKSVVAAIKDINAEIIVVDNNSSDESCLMVEDLFPYVKLIRNNENYGFSKGNNIGVHEAQGDLICILNPDTVLAEDTFLKIFSYYEGKENIGVVGCKLINGAGLFLPESKRNIPYPLVALKKIFGNSNDYYANHLTEDENGEVDILVGAFMVMRKQIFELVHGFDEDFFMYGEDIDLSYRIKKLGYKNYYLGETTIIHFKGESTLRDRNYLKRFFGAMEIFYKKHFKKNLLVDFFVRLGIKVAFSLEKPRKPKRKHLENYVLLSDKKNEELNKVLSLPLRVVKTLDDINGTEEIIFDANYITYNEIIDYISENRDSDLTYKILPNESSFILGSNSGFDKGEIIEFK